MTRFAKSFSSFRGILTLVAMMLLSAQAQAATSLKSLAWQADGPGTRTVTPDSGPADAVTFDYQLVSTSVYSQQTWTFSAIAPESTVLNFDWNYTGFHSWYAVYANAVAFADGPNGRTTTPLYSRNYGDAWQVSGTASLQTSAGYAFGVIVQGSNFDLDPTLRGSIKLTAR